MLRSVISAMVYMGSALMVYNIYGFISFTRFVRGLKTWGKNDRIFIFPISLLIMFLLGYIIVGTIGSPDIVMAGILFGGSIFVFVMYRLLRGVTMRIIANERKEAEVMATDEMNRARTSFLASVSHEMRTPMNVILGLDGLALKNPVLMPDTRDKLEKIGLSARHLSGLIDNILDMNRIETGELTIKKEPFSMEDALEQVIAITRTLCEEKQLSFTASIGEGVGRSFVGDATEIKRVLLCMLDNAVKYNDVQGFVKLTAKCEPTEAEDTFMLRFEVEDDGVGIDPAFMPKVFELFTQEDSSFSNSYGGSGMGLAIARRLAVQMGGTIDARSQKDVGSTFTLSLPLPLAQEHEQAPEPGTDLDSIEGCRILIVEDIEENAEIISDLLELEGAESERAENGQVAVDMIDRAEAHYYDAVLMDLRMPVMDGLESARRIRHLDRQDTRHMPIIAVTANAFAIDVQNSMEAGMNEHLVKPIDAERLYASLKHWIGKSRHAWEGAGS